ncbi:MAG: YutD-like domain-containing protein, partial [Bacilli bacterium]
TSQFEIIENYKDAYTKEEVGDKCTDYFDTYDYILGDYSYGTLRLKGFCDKQNKLFKPINDVTLYKEYVKNNCSYDCKYFLIKRVKDSE